MDDCEPASFFVMGVEIGIEVATVEWCWLDWHL
jgi:hypothetical protein